MEHHPQDELPAVEHMVDYDRHSQMQSGLVRSRSDLLGAVVDDIGRVSPEFLIVDYGCGPGQSAIDAARAVIDAYRRLDPDGPVTMRHADQAGNDWNALFALAHGPNGYHHTHAGLRTEAAVGSFYSRLAAPNSVTLATCFTASHWLSRALRVDSPGTLWFADLDGDARKRFAELARADWVQFLRCRASELRPGGCAVISGIGSVPDPDERNGVMATARGIYRAMFDVARSMVDDGLLSSDALDRFVFPVWFPTAEEARAPIVQETDLREQFEIIRADVVPADFHPGDVFEDHRDDPQRYAELYCGYARGFGESALRLHLFGRSAENADEVDRLTTEFFARLTQLYLDEPGQHPGETMAMTVVLRRRP